MYKKEYYNISLKIIPKNMIYTYDLPTKQLDGHVCAKLVKFMYSLVQLVIIYHYSLK